MTPSRFAVVSALGGAFGVLLPVLAGDAAVAGETTSPRPEFSWKGSYAEALEAARRDELLLIVYFRPVAVAEPRPLLLAHRAPQLAGIAAGVRVRAAELVELAERLRVTRLPALVVLDSRENVLKHWQEDIPRDVWQRVGQTFREERENEARDQKELELARDLVDQGRDGAAYEKLRPLLRSARTAYRVYSVAKELEMRLVEAGKRRLLMALAADGIAADAELIARLAGLFPRPVPPELKAAVESELRRLRSTTIGGRPRG